MNTGRTSKPPFPDQARPGRAFLSPCRTSVIHEFRVNGVLWLAGSIAGLGWSQPWQGSVGEINETGTLVTADGSERRITWSPEGALTSSRPSSALDPEVELPRGHSQRPRSL